MRLLGLFAPPKIEKLRDKGDVEKLIKALGHKGDPSVTDAAKAALVEIGSPSVRPLIAILAHPDECQRKSVAHVLKGIGPPAVESLIATLKDSNWEVRHAAAQVLGEIGDKRTIPPLIETLSDRHSGVRAAAANALRKKRRLCN